MARAWGGGETGCRRGGLPAGWVGVGRSRMRVGWAWEKGVGGCQPRRVGGRAHRAWIYVRWVGVWARAWEGHAARGAEWDGMKCKERGAEWADGRLEREWDGGLWDLGTI